MSITYLEAFGKRRQKCVRGSAVFSLRAGRRLHLVARSATKNLVRGISRRVIDSPTCEDAMVLHGRGFAADRGLAGRASKFSSPIFPTSASINCPIRRDLFLATDSLPHHHRLRSAELPAAARFTASRLETIYPTTRPDPSLTPRPLKTPTAMLLEVRRDYDDPAFFATQTYSIIILKPTSADRSAASWASPHRAAKARHDHVAYRRRWCRPRSRGGKLASEGPANRSGGFALA